MRLLPCPTIIVAITVATLVPSATFAQDAYSLVEPDTDARPRIVTVQVKIDGNVVTSGGEDKPLRHDLSASAAYRFLERRLTGAGRDAATLRSLRAYEQATVRTKISDRLSQTALPPSQRLIAVNGHRQGLIRYAPNGTLTREALDLLDSPGDSLAIVGLLPPRDVEVGEEWSPPDWAVQMLTAIEAVEESELACTLNSVENGVARVSFEGQVAGLRLGAPTSIELEGTFDYQLEGQLITTITLNHTEKAAIGTVTPGVDSQVVVTVTRALSDNDGGLTDETLEAIPLEAPPERLPLVFVAQPWGLRLVHGRGWHVFHANFESAPKVVILRLLDQGSLICQCNFSPVPSAEPGQHTPLEDYEASVKQALGDQFGEITDRSNVPTTDGRKIFRLTVNGNYQLPGSDEPKSIPMSWTYYLIAHPSGQQVSFVFAVEPGLRERLAERDVRMVESLLFAEPAR